MNDAASFFLNSKSNVVLYETVEITHPAFSRDYRIVKNNRLGARFGIDGQMHDFEYYPLKITRMDSMANLDQSIKITVGDLGDMINMEIERVRASGQFSVKPKVVYRAYRSDNIMEPVIGAIDLEMTNVTAQQDGAAFEAKPPSVNSNPTGETYTLSRFQGLRGFL